MANVFRLIGRLNLGALATLLVIFAGLVAEGADAPARGALLSFALLAFLLIAAVATSSTTLARVATTHWPSGIGAILFLIWSLAAAAPLPSDFLVEHLGHPLARTFSLWPPSISISPHSTLEGLASMLGPMAAFVLGALFSTTRNARDWIGRFIAVLTLFFALYALNLFFTFQAYAGGRLDAGVISANAAAALFGILALFAAALIVRAANGRLGGSSAAQLPPRMAWASGFIRAPLSFAALIFALACALLTASRGGLFATAIGFIAFILLLLSRRFGPARSSFLIAPIIGVIAVAAWLFFRGSSPVLDRLTDTAAAAEGRRLLLEPHWDAFLARPLLGNGLNTYHELNSMAADPENWSTLSYAGAAHNIYVQALEEVGIVGFALMALMLAPPIVRALATALFGKSGVEWAAALFGAAALLLLHGAVDFELQIPAIAALFAFCMGAFTGPTKE